MARWYIRSFCWVIAASFLAASSPQAAPQDSRDIIVKVQKKGEWVIVDVDFPVDATVPETWNVMTDYDNMSKFVSNLLSSRILGREGNTLSVEQKGKASRGPLTISFENVREIVLTPQREVHSRLVSGDLKASEFTTRVIDRGAFTQIINHGEFIPNIWVPPVIGPALIEAETRKQFQELRLEILRRKAETAAGRH
ncbi:MAG: hypothetical protein E6H74_02340 [Betaproteobacteria bacterium]|nr:MAG: hypothetical protein E6H74_02340 [Betaproteobacteria bacterium]